MKMILPENSLKFIVVVSSMCVFTGAATGKDFYAGKTISINVGGSPGGGHDTYARTIARHIPRYIPGTPTVIVRNMPGAGSVKAASYIYSVAPKDGTEIAAVYPGAIVGPLLSSKFAKVRYKPVNLKYIGSAENGARLCTTYQKSKIKSFADLVAQKSIFGASSPGGAAYDYGQMVKKSTGAQIKIVAGYRASRKLVLDMERGTIDGFCGWDWSTAKAQKSDWIRDKKLNLLVQIGLQPDKELVALGVPSLLSFIKKESDQKAVKLIISQQVFGRPYIAPPETPAAQLAILRKAYMATMSDKSFLADAKKSRLDISPSSGEELQKLIKSLQDSPKATVDRAKELLVP